MAREDHQKINLARKFCWCLLVPGLLAAVLIPRAALSDEAEQSKLITETEDFLSDRGRVGSLVGGILAGAALANPLAPLVGTVAGFFVGKHSDFTRGDDETAVAARNRYANRSIVPADNQNAGVLTMSSGGSDGSATVFPAVDPSQTDGVDVAAQY